MSAVTHEFHHLLTSPILVIVILIFKVTS